MPDIELPNPKTRRWSGPYLGNYYGDLYRTFNIDLENNPGHITISKSFVSVADTDDDTNLSLPLAFLRTNAGGLDRWWALGSQGRMFTTDSDNPTLPIADWYTDTIANSPIDANDMTIHENDSDSANGENVLFVTRDSDIASLNDTGAHTWNRNWWTVTKGHASDSALNTNESHPIEYFGMRRISVIGDGNLIHTIDKNKNTSTKRLVLPAYLKVKHIFTTAYRIWILCKGELGRNGAIIEWDGSSESYNQIYNAQSNYPLSGVNYYETPIVINNRGLILEFDGNGFSPMVRNGQIIAFPFYQEFGNAFFTSGQVAIRPRGMTVSDDGLIYINVKEPGNNSFKQLGGIWCLNPITGNLYSKYSLGHDGDTDYGQQIIDSPGAIQAINMEQTTTNASYLLAGARIGLGSVASIESKIWYMSRAYSSTVRRGFFITQFFPASDIQEAWDVIWLRYSLMKTNGCKIIVKAKGVNNLLDSNRQPIQKIGTWTSGTKFTVTLAAGDDELAVGDEIEVVGGTNAGTLAHITVISGAHGALQTITIDETVTNTSGTAYIRFDRWKKLGVIDSTTKYFTPLNIGISSSFIQFKVEMRGPAGEYFIKNLDINLKKQTDKRK